MEHFASYPAEELIRDAGFDCACGKHHVANRLKYIKIGSGVIGTLPEILRAMGKTHPYVITDANEYKAAGETVEGLLKAADIPYSLHIVPGEKGLRVAPNERALGSVAMHFDKAADILVAVGSGVINDITKCAAAMSKLPYVIVATAPSMDGYASDTSAMEVNNVKSTLKEVLPTAIIADTDILKEAPMRTLWAGLGDMIGKYSALCEWRIAALVNGEPYCEEVAELVNVSLRKILAGAKGVKTRNPESIEAITEGLILSGLAMAFVGISRPAAGLDHYFSHCWEMIAIADGKESDLHGIQVGIGTLYTLKLYEKLKTLHPTMERVEAEIAKFDDRAWENKIRTVFKDTADDIIQMEKAAGKNEKEGRRQRAARIISHWDEILRIVEETAPSYNDIRKIMEEVGMPLTAEDIGLTHNDAVVAFDCSRDVRTKYLLSSLIWDIGYTEECKAFL